MENQKLKIPKNLGFYKDLSMNYIGFITEEINGKWFNIIGGAWKLKRMSRKKATKKEIVKFKINYYKHLKFLKRLEEI